jgi:hypothetical protein
MNLTIIDWLIMLVYFAFVLGIGVVLKRKVKTSGDFFLAGRAIPAWVGRTVLFAPIASTTRCWLHDAQTASQETPWRWRTSACENARSERRRGPS